MEDIGQRGYLNHKRGIVPPVVLKIYWKTIISVITIKIVVITTGELWINVILFLVEIIEVMAALLGEV